MTLDPIVAYFSMEIALEPAFPTYSGGLGILGGDMLRAAADAGVPMVGLSLVHRLGNFRQHLDARGHQTESPDPWHPEAVLEPVAPTVELTVLGRQVRVRAWRYTIKGVSGFTVPVYLLDTDLPENTPEDRALTNSLYGGDERYRLCQEAVLGMGGIYLFDALGFQRLTTYHMNEGHSALLTIALLAKQAGARGLTGATAEDRKSVHSRCVFTTHTPVPAGHDRFRVDLVREVLGDDVVAALDAAGTLRDGELNMTELALTFSRYVNGVAMRHGEVAQQMFPQFPINAITNGVHAVTWAAPAFARLFDKHVPEWREDNLYLRYAISIPLDEIRQAHAEAKNALLSEVKNRLNVRFNSEALTIGFARRATAYKRADLVFSDQDRLRRIVASVGKIQVLYAGKAHPKDEGGKALIEHVFQAAAALGSTVPVAYVENYDMALARLMCGGVDLWLNTPQRPMEASGTSGMKAAINGVPSFSTFDGWWIEGHIEGVTGWAIGDDGDSTLDGDSTHEVESLYQKLSDVIIPLYYRDPDGYARVMQMAIAVNGSFFNTERMIDQYVTNAYRLPTVIAGYSQVSP